MDIEEEMNSVIKARKMRESKQTGINDTDDRTINSGDADYDDNEQNMNELCIEPFLNEGVCEKQGCKKDHSVDSAKIKKGICVHEFRKADSCPYGKCKFTHRFPSELRKNKEAQKIVKETVERMKEKRRTKIPSNQELN